MESRDVTVCAGDELLEYAIAAEEAGFTERIYTPEMSEQNGKAVGSDTIRQSVCISADPEVHIEHARKYIDMGFDHLIFHAAGPDQRAFIEEYGQRVLPRLRELSKRKSRPAA